MAASGQAAALPREYTRDELLDIAASAYLGNEQREYRSIKNVERGFMWWLRRKSTNGTVLAPAVEALNAAGIPTKPRVGGLMDVLGLSREDVHNIACYCHCAKTTGANVIHFLWNAKRITR